MGETAGKDSYPTNPTAEAGRSLVVDAPTGTEWQAWLATPLAARAYVVALVGLGAALTFVGSHGEGRASLPTLGGLMVASMVNVELGRRAEGGRVERQRLHKGMAAWVFAAALLLDPGLAGWVAVVSYAYADVRGMRIRRWKWLGSCGIVIIAAFASSTVFQALAGGRPLAAAGSAAAVASVLAAATAFLLAEALLFGIVSRLNATQDEIQLRAALASRGFYLVEAAVLLSGGVAAVTYRWSPGMLLLAVPAFLLMQRGMLHQPLQHEARHDLKTGVLNSEAWRSAASGVLAHQKRAGRAVAVLIVDVDHFKAVNDGFGHLAGDDVLVRIAQVVVGGVRKTDLVGRFGGDEFCALLAVATFGEAVAAAERIRTEVAQLAFDQPGLAVTASIGVALAATGDRADLAGAVALADRALYEAKTEGRNRVCGRSPESPTRPPPVVTLAQRSRKRLA